jgi:hypothetical protein
VKGSGWEELEIEMNQTSAMLSESVVGDYYQRWQLMVNQRLLIGTPAQHAQTATK